MTVQDALTGLPGRTAFDDALRAVIGDTQPFTMALVDMDNLMQLNEAHGAEVGDHLLQTLAAMLAATGEAYRLSGDEFALLRRGLTLEQGFLHMETLRREIESGAEKFALPEGRPVTVTVGVAQFPRDGKDALTLLNAADAALLSAKEAGRNQVGLPPNEEMVMKSCYYPAHAVRKLKTLAERLGQRESHLLREALSDLLRKHDPSRAA